MKQYHELLEHILSKGTKKGDRTGTGTLSVFGYQNRYNLSEGFPIVTTKKVSFKSIVVELLWFLKGDTNIKYLVDNGVNIWNEDAYNYYCKVVPQIEPDQVRFDYETFVELIKKTSMNTIKEYYSNKGYTLGDCGHQYGRLWRNWGIGKTKSVKTGKTYPSGEFMYDFVEEGIDQIANLIDGLKKNPESRRHIITAWNPVTLDKMALHACHALVQFNCRPINTEDRIYKYSLNKISRHELMFGDEEEGLQQDLSVQLDNAEVPRYYLDCHLYQRSADVVLGVPFNISSYCLLTHILAKICNMVPGDFVHSFGDVHIYSNHMDAVKEQLERDPTKYKLPELVIKDEGNDWAAISNLDFSLIEMLDRTDFKLKDYNHYPKLESEAKLNTGLK